VTSTNDKDIVNFGINKHGRAVMPDGGTCNSVFCLGELRKGGM
jgi:hypothetical protein